MYLEEDKKFNYKTHIIIGRANLSDVWINCELNKSVIFIKGFRFEITTTVELTVSQNFNVFEFKTISCLHANSQMPHDVTI